MRTLSGLFGLLLLAGCYNAETFQTDFVQSTCDWYDRCDLLEILDYEDTQDCVDELFSESVAAQEGDTCPGFNRPEARSCIDELETRGCEDGFTQPSSCQEACTEAS